MINNVRCVVADEKMWFPIVDITRLCLDGVTVHPSASRWFKKNIPNESIRKIKVASSVTRKGGSLLCVDANNVRIIGMYEAHLLSGMDFRAKWADLPDTPALCSDAKKEVSWRQLYNWSKAEHLANTGLASSTLSQLRVLAHRVSDKLGVRSPEKQVSYREALAILGVK